MSISRWINDITLMKEDALRLLTLNEYAEQAKAKIRKSIAMDVKRVINNFTDNHMDSYNIAHVALDDYNLSDETINWLLNESIPSNRDEYAKDHNVSQSEIDEVVEFLKLLLKIPEVVRDSINE